MGWNHQLEKQNTTHNFGKAFVFLVGVFIFNYSFGEGEYSLKNERGTKAPRLLKLDGVPKFQGVQRTGAY